MKIDRFKFEDIWGVLNGKFVVKDKRGKFLAKSRSDIGNVYDLMNGCTGILEREVIDIFGVEDGMIIFVDD